MTVKSFMLATGQELIASLVTETGQGYMIKDPLIVHMMRGPDGKPQLGFAPWSMIHSESATSELFDHGLLCKPVDVLSEVEASYLSNVSGILVPPAPSGRILQG